MKRPILVSLAAATLSLGLLGSAPAAQAATSHSPTAATMNPADDPELPDLVLADVLFHDHDHDGDHDDDGDHDSDRDDDSGHGRRRCSGVISICLG